MGHVFTSRVVIGWLEFAGLENDGLHQYGLTLRCLEYILRGRWKRGSGKRGSGKRGTRRQGWKTRERKSMESQKSPLFNIVTSVLQQPLELMWTRRTLRICVFLSYKKGGIVSPYLTQTRFKRKLPSFDATTWNRFSCCLQSAPIC